jgi:hypothetical protein
MTPAKSLDALHNHARSFVTHWASDDGADDLPAARAACRDVASAASALTKANDAARAMLAALESVFQGMRVETRGADGRPTKVYLTLESCLPVAPAIAQAKAAGITTP